MKLYPKFVSPFETAEEFRRRSGETMSSSLIAQLNCTITTIFDDANLSSASFTVGRLGGNNFKLNLRLLFVAKL
jgi:hypothetical protein